MNDAKEDGAIRARRNLRDAVVWFALGAAILAGSWSMDRLQNQGINPYTIPGLLPGLLGIAMMILGALLALRSIGEGARKRPASPPGDSSPGEPSPGESSPGDSSGGHGQLILALALCLVFTGVLVGHGLPFWLAAAIFVTAAILTLHRSQAGPGRSRLREVATAALIGLCAGGAITLVFQVLFLVRLP